jgi:hypothetical protein
VVGVALEEGAEVGVGTAVGAPAAQVVAAAEELGAAALEQLQPGGRVQVAGEGHPQGEGAVVADVGVREELDEALAAPVGDAVHLLAAPAALGQAALAHPGLEGGQLDGQRAGHRRRWDDGALLDRLHGALRLEAGQRRVERAEADRGAAGQQLTEPLLQLVAVELLLGEQAEDGEVDHGGWAPLHRVDVSIRCNGQHAGRRRIRQPRPT